MGKRSISRRGFVKSMSAGAAIGWAGFQSRSALSAPLAATMGCGGGCGGGGMGGGSGGVIDPPVGALFQDPPEATLFTTPDRAGVRQVNITARQAKVNINGVSVNLLTYNGTFPGPTIRVQKGDIVGINFTNSLPTTLGKNMLGYDRQFTNLHTHGWHVSPEGMADNVMYELASGQSRAHEYDTGMQPAGTLNFYHTHKHGVSAEQYWSGMVGALIVEDETDVLAPYETHLLILKDIALSGSSPSPHSMMGDYMNGKEGAIVMVNGQVNPRLYIKAGQVQRWRILNASNARHYRLSLPGHSLHLIGTDGGLLNRPYAKSEILLAPGERVDVLVQATQSTGNFKLTALPYSRMGMMQSPTITLLTLSYSGKTTRQPLPATINPEAARLDLANLSIAAERTLALSMGMGNGYINGQDFDVNPYTIMSKLGTYEIWRIINSSGMDHPFHQHVNHAQVLEVVGGDNFYATIPAWKDVVLVPKMGSVTLLVPIVDYPGMTMFHCHILEHEDIGMMGMWHIMDGEMGGGMDGEMNGGMGGT